MIHDRHANQPRFIIDVLALPPVRSARACAQAEDVHIHDFEAG